MDSQIQIQLTITEAPTTLVSLEMDKQRISHISKRQRQRPEAWPAAGSSYCQLNPVQLLKCLYLLQDRNNQPVCSKSSSSYLH